MADSKVSGVQDVPLISFSCLYVDGFIAPIVATAQMGSPCRYYTPRTVAVQSFPCGHPALFELRLRISLKNKQVSSSPRSCVVLGIGFAAAVSS